MRAIFISYRRDDAEGEAGRLFSDLSKHFGEDRVFMDVVAIEPGRDFRKVIDQNVASCGVLLAMIGPHWVDARTERRLNDPADFVRLETASALRRDIPVVPVLVHEAKMPVSDQLPEDLKELCYRNAVELTHARWESDVQVLIKALEKCVGAAVAAPESSPQPAAPAIPPAAPPPWAPTPVQVPVYQAPPGAKPWLPPALTPGAAPAVSGGLKAVICLIGFFAPIVPIIMGIIYMMDANLQKKSAGKLWLWVGIGEFIFACLIWSALSMNN